MQVSRFATLLGVLLGSAAWWGCKPVADPPAGTESTGSTSNGGTTTASGGGAGGAGGSTTGSAGAGGKGGGDSVTNEPLCLDAANCPGKVSIVHAWGITNPSPALWGTGYSKTTTTMCALDTLQTCQKIVESKVASAPDGPCCATTPNGPDCSGTFAGKWQSWIRDWWVEGWLPSIGLQKSDVRRFHVIYNRNGFFGGPQHNVDCEARGQLRDVFVSAYRQCDTHVVVTTHSNGGVTFLWAWRSFVEDFLDGAAGAGLDQDRAATCSAKGRNLPNGDAPPLYVNGQLMQAAVGPDGSLVSASDFFPLQPYDTVGKKYWEPRDGKGKLRALPGIRFYYNHEDVLTYDLKNVAPIGRNQVRKWLDGSVDKNPVGQAFWDAHVGQPPFAALHVCDNNVICGDLAVIVSPADVPDVSPCSKSCPTLQTFYDSSMSANSLCVNPCHKSCWGPTALTAILIKEPAVYPEKFPFIFGNANIQAMAADNNKGGWLDNTKKLDWRELYDLQQVWCGQVSLNEEQEPYKMGYGPKFGPLIDGRNEVTGEVVF